jgi:hypothetical protein
MFPSFSINSQTTYPDDIYVAFHRSCRNAVGSSAASCLLRHGFSGLVSTAEIARVKRLGGSSGELSKTSVAIVVKYHECIRVQWLTLYFLSKILFLGDSCNPIFTLIFKEHIKDSLLLRFAPVLSGSLFADRGFSQPSLRNVPFWLRQVQLKRTSFPWLDKLKGLSHSIGLKVCRSSQCSPSR